MRCVHGLEACPACRGPAKSKEEEMLDAMLRDVPVLREALMKMGWNPRRAGNACIALVAAMIEIEREEGRTSEDALDMITILLWEYHALAKDSMRLAEEAEARAEAEKGGGRR